MSTLSHSLADDHFTATVLLFYGLYSLDGWLPDISLRYFLYTSALRFSAFHLEPIKPYSDLNTLKYI